jgi:5-methylcytosine-specific restriction endonuclease McrA
MQENLMTASVLTRPTLVLNRNWQPVAVTTVARSLVKVFNESARIVDPSTFQQCSWQDWIEMKPAEGDPVIRTQWLELRVPEVITLTRYDRVPVKVVAFSRRNVFKRDGYTCQYCACRPGSEELTIDHVIPRSRGGVSSWSNCVLACINCNLRKSNRTPEQARMPLRKPPTRPRWNPLYAPHGVRIESWAKFVSEAYWNVQLEE